MLLQFSVLFVISQSSRQGCGCVTNIAYGGFLRLTVLMWACKFVHYVGRLQGGCLVLVVLHDQVRCASTSVVYAERYVSVLSRGDICSNDVL